MDGALDIVGGAVGLGVGGLVGAKVGPLVMRSPLVPLRLLPLPPLPSPLSLLPFPPLPLPDEELEPFPPLPLPDEELEPSSPLPLPFFELLLLVLLLEKLDCSVVGLGVGESVG